MSIEKKGAIKWLDTVEPHNYTAATSYLSLIYNTEKVVDIIAELEATEIVEFKAKDIFRASQLSLLGVSNLHVEKDLSKIAKGVALSPILLVRDSINAKVIIADGYHRICALYEYNEDIFIKCKII